MALHDTGVGSGANPVIDCSADCDVDVQIVAFILIAHALALLWFQQVHNRLQLLGEALVFV